MLSGCELSPTQTKEILDKVTIELEQITVQKDLLDQKKEESILRYNTAELAQQELLKQVETARSDFARAQACNIIKTEQDTKSTSGNELSPGVIVGIILAVLVGLGCIIGISYFSYKRYRDSNTIMEDNSLAQTLTRTQTIKNLNDSGFRTGRPSAAGRGLAPSSGKGPPPAFGTGKNRTG